MLPPERIQQIMAIQESSMSSAGRNAHLRKFVIPSSMGPKATEEEKMRARKLQAAWDDAVTAHLFANDSVNVDTGLRQLLCSSPRLHPQVELQRQSEYEQQRLAIFKKMQQDVSRLRLVDVAPPTSPLPTTDDVNPSGTGRRVSFPTTAGSFVPRPPSFKAAGTVALFSGGVFTPSSAKQPTDAAADKPHQHQQQQPPEGDNAASPRFPFGVPTSSSFLSPERWREPKGRGVPPVGHYRPKFSAVEHRASGTTFPPLRIQTPRAAADAADFAAASRQPQTAREGPSSGAFLGQSGPLAPTASGGGGQAATATNQKSLPSQVFADSETAVFLSKSPNRAAYRKSAAPDTSYWPFNDNATGRPSMRLKGCAVRLDRMLPRIPIKNYCGPDAIYDLPSVQSARSPVKMLIPSAIPPKLSDARTLHDPGPGLELRFPNHSSFIDFSKQSPRRPEKPKELVTVSIDECLNDIRAAIDRAPHVPHLDRIQPHGDLAMIPLANNLMYDVSFDLVRPTPHSAIIRAGDPGHLPLFEPTITDKCSYSPNVDVVRSKIIRNVDFSKLSPRKQTDGIGRMLDLQYDAKESLVAPRVCGNPMLNYQFTREQRAAARAQKLQGPDKYYAASTDFGEYKRFVGPHCGASVEFSKQIAREKMPGRMSAERFVGKVV